MRWKVEDLRRREVRLDTSEAQGEDRTLGKEVFVVEIIVRHQSGPPLPRPLTGDLVQSLEPTRESLPPTLDSPRTPLTEVTNTDRPPNINSHLNINKCKEIFQDVNTSLEQVGTIARVCLAK